MNSLILSLPKSIYIFQNHIYLRFKHIEKIHISVRLVQSNYCADSLYDHLAEG